MQTIIITGPSGSGKTFISNKLTKLFKDSILIKTDSFYRDNILIKFLSIFLYDVYDRPLSIKKNAIKKILRSIHNKDQFITFYNYDYKRKYSSNTKININYTANNQFIILEGIFAHRLELNYKDTINIICEEGKEICYKRRLLRDQLERGRKNKEVKKKFSKSWYLFYRNIKEYIEKNKIISLDREDKISYEKLVINLQNLYNKNNQKK